MSSTPQTHFEATRRFVPAQIDGVISDSLWHYIEYFRNRADELYLFRTEVKWGLQHVEIDRADPKGPAIKGSLPENPLELEGLYRRFRFFVLKDEKSNYRNLCHALEKTIGNEIAKLYFSYMSETFLRSNVVEAAFGSYEEKYSEEEIIRIWFNGHYFHGGNNKVSRLNAFKNLVSSNGAEVTLFHVVLEACEEVRNLRWLLKDTTRVNPWVLIPNYCPVRSS